MTRRFDIVGDNDINVYMKIFIIKNIISVIRVYSVMRCVAFYDIVRNFC